MRSLLATDVAIVLAFLIIPQWLTFQHNDWVWAMSVVSFFGAGVGACVATYAVMELRRR